MSETMESIEAQAAPTAQREVCEGKDVEQRRRESRLRKAFWMCAAVAFLATLPGATSLALPEAADYCWSWATNFEDPSIDPMAAKCHRTGLRLPSVEGQWDSGEKVTGLEDATAERRRRNPTAVG